MDFNVPSLAHIHHRIDLKKDFFPFFEFMALHMTMSYNPQAAHMNEETP
jgi:hypothetical protein